MSLFGNLDWKSVDQQSLLLPNIKQIWWMSLLLCLEDNETDFFFQVSNLVDQFLIQH